MVFGGDGVVVMVVVVMMDQRYGKGFLYFWRMLLRCGSKSLARVTPLCTLWSDYFSLFQFFDMNPPMGWIARPRQTFD